MGKEAEGDKLYGKAEKFIKPSVMSMRIKADWEQAGPLFEQAALCYKQASAYQKARDAYEKAAAALEKKGSPWHAAKHMEQAAVCAKDGGAYDDAVLLVKTAAEYYLQAGKGPTRCEAMARGARMMEGVSSSHAVQLYDDALDAYDAEGRMMQANDVFKSAVSLHVKEERYDEACAILMKYAAACEAAGMRASLTKSYLGCIVLRLYSQQVDAAWQEYQDFLSVPTFQSSDEAFAAEAVFDAYRSGDAEQVKTAVANARVFTTLDASQGRLARRLPQGDVGAQAVLLGGGDAGDDDDDDDDFT